MSKSSLSSLKLLQKLKLSQALRFRIDAKGHIYGQVSKSKGDFYLAEDVFTLLINIQRQNLKDIAKEDTNLIADLLAQGFLVEVDKETNKETDKQTDKTKHSDEIREQSSQEIGFGNHWIQWAMLADKPRGEAYFNGIKAHVKPSSVVLDIGSGTGLLSAMSLHFGAKKVYSIEETSIAASIVPNLKKMDIKVTDKNFKLINQSSYDHTPDPQVNLVVSELFGNDPFQEGVFSTLHDISTRLKSKSTKYLPEKISIYFECIKLLESPMEHRIKEFYSRKSNDFLSKFNQCAKKNLKLEKAYFPISLHKNQFQRVSDVVSLGELRLDPPPSWEKLTHAFKGKKKIALKSGKIGKIGKMEMPDPALKPKGVPQDDKHNTDGTYLGIMWFRIQVSEKFTVSSHPQEHDASWHWSPVAYFLPSSLAIGYSTAVPSDGFSRTGGKEDFLAIEYFCTADELVIDLSPHLSSGPNK